MPLTHVWCWGQVGGQANRSQVHILNVPKRDLHHAPNRVGPWIIGIARPTTPLVVAVARRSVGPDGFQQRRDAVPPCPVDELQELGEQRSRSNLHTKQMNERPRLKGQ